MRRTRLIYHKMLKDQEKLSAEIRKQKMAEALIDNNTRDFWTELKKSKPKNSQKAATIDEKTKPQDIANAFQKSFSKLYNSVPSTQSESTDFELNNIHTYNNHMNTGKITPGLVSIALHHLKNAKSDGNMGLMSDHLLNGPPALFDHLFSMWWQCTAIALHIYRYRQLCHWKNQEKAIQHRLIIEASRLLLLLGNC